MTVTMTVAMAVAVCVTSGKSRLDIVDPGSETLDYVPNMFNFVELDLQSVNLGDYTFHPGDFSVCVLNHIPCSVVVRLD
jgi:hypothetical protein